ncbi:helix-turn-helix domain-containing protein [Erythrobacter sp. HA6-11]
MSGLALDCVGERLAMARRDAGLSVADVAERTKVSCHYLKALESEAFHRLPSRVHTFGFARAFAKAVALDDGEISEALRVKLDQNAPANDAVPAEAAPQRPRGRFANMLRTMSLF